MRERLIIALVRMLPILLLPGCMPRVQNPASPFWLNISAIGSASLLGAIGCAIASFCVTKRRKKERLDRLAGLLFVAWIAILLLS